MLKISDFQIVSFCRGRLVIRHLKSDLLLNSPKKNIGNMLNMKNIHIKEVHVRWVGIVLLTLVLPFIFKHEGEVNEPSYWQRLPVTFLFVSTFWNGNWFIIRYYRKRYPKFEETHKRILMTILVCSAFIVAADTLLCYTFSKIGVLGSFSERDTSFHLMLDFGNSAFIALIYEVSFFMGKWRESIQEAEQLKARQLRSQFETLKTQVSPHFLFNSLNTLMALIPESPEMALRFTEKLSEVYRYILHNREKELVPLHIELEFMRAYVFLQQMRFGENFQIDCQISNEVRQNSHVVPLTLQMLVENALKHNVVSNAKPLTLQIYTDGNGFLLVKNKLQRKGQVNDSNGIGLENIKKQYHYLSNEEVKTIVTREYFTVVLPLPHLSKTNHLKTAVEAVSV